MDIILVPMGSHGDVHPFVGIALGLRARGHRVRLILNPFFEYLASNAGLETILLGTAEEYCRLAQDPRLWHPIEGTLTVLSSIAQAIEPVYRAIDENAIPGETVVGASSLALGARVAQERLRIPTATIHLQPSAFLSAIDPPRLPGAFMPRWMPKWIRRAQFALVDRILDSRVGPALNSFRAELGLAAVKRVIGKYIHSPQRVIGLFPAWFAAPAADWPPHVRLTGFPLFDESGFSELSPELCRFLDDGDPPIAFTPGSAMWSGQSFLRESARACQLLGRRGLLLTRHLDHLPADLPPSVMHVRYAPFSQLLPRCAALVHHGGIGTSAQAMLAAVPQLVVPHGHDQFDNAARMMRLGVAKVLTSDHYRGQSVAAILEDLTEPASVRLSCHDVAARFEGTDPVGETCHWIEQLRAASPIEISA